MRTLFLFILLCTLSSSASSQNITLPDSISVIKNHVKTVRVYSVLENEKRMTLFLTYDDKGRVVRESENDNSYYYAYRYDERGRRTSATQYGKTGIFSQKYVTEYLNDTITKVTHYESIDSTQVAHIHYYDQHGRILRNEDYNKGILKHVTVQKFNAAGDVIYAYDSAYYSASIRENGLLVKVRSYNTDYSLTHEYTYTYSQQRVTHITDSVSPKFVSRYHVLYNQYSLVVGAELNGVKMNEKEFDHFRSSYQYVLPATDGIDEDYGLPIPELVNTHVLTKDKKGNIIRDELTQKQGSFSQTYVYEYEYEYY